MVATMSAAKVSVAKTPVVWVFDMLACFALVLKGCKTVTECVGV